MVELYGNRGFVFPRHYDQFKHLGQDAKETALTNDHGAPVRSATDVTIVPAEAGKSAPSTAPAARRSAPNMEGFAALHQMFKNIVALLAQGLQLGSMLPKTGLSTAEEPEGVAVPDGSKSTVTSLVLAPPTLFVAKVDEDDEDNESDEDGKADNSRSESGDGDEASGEDDASRRSPATVASIPVVEGEASEEPLSQQDIDLDIRV